MGLDVGVVNINYLQMACHKISASTPRVFANFSNVSFLGEVLPDSIFNIVVLETPETWASLARPNPFSFLTFLRPMSRRSREGRPA